MLHIVTKTWRTSISPFSLSVRARPLLIISGFRGLLINTILLMIRSGRVVQWQNIHFHNFFNFSFYAIFNRSRSKMEAKMNNRSLLAQKAGCWSVNWQPHDSESSARIPNNDNFALFSKVVRCAITTITLILYPNATLQSSSRCAVGTVTGFPETLIACFVSWIRLLYSYLCS